MRGMQWIGVGLCVRVCVNPVDTTPPKRLEPALDAAAVGASFDHFIFSPIYPVQTTVQYNCYVTLKRVYKWQIPDKVSSVAVIGHRHTASSYLSFILRVKENFLTEIWKRAPSTWVSHTTLCHGNPQNTHKGDPEWSDTCTYKTWQRGHRSDNDSRRTDVSFNWPSSS